MEHIQLIYVRAGGAKLIYDLSPSSRHRSGKGWAYDLVMAIAHFQTFFSSRRDGSHPCDQGNLDAVISRAIREYNEPTIHIEKRIENVHVSSSISIMMLNGWRVRKIPNYGLYVIESN